jgi:hypothetical protein
MKIEIEKNLVKFYPEGSEEKAKVQLLWQMIVDCAGTNKKMVAIGEYSPIKNHDCATFMVEDLASNQQVYEVIRVKEDCRCYCDVCNKFVDMKKGDAIPLCCGKIMEIID